MKAQLLVTNGVRIGNVRRDRGACTHPSSPSSSLDNRHSPRWASAASTTYLAWIVFSGKNLNPSMAVSLIDRFRLPDTSFRVNPPRERSIASL